MLWYWCFAFMFVSYDVSNCNLIGLFFSLFWTNQVQLLFRFYGISIFNWLVKTGPYKFIPLILKRLLNFNQKRRFVPSFLVWGFFFLPFSPRPFPLLNSTPGPVTGRAELTGSRSLLPRNRKPKRNQSKPIDVDVSTSMATSEVYDGEGVQDSDATDLSNFASLSATAPHWNSFLEPRNPFTLAWKVRVADDQERNNHDGKNNSGIQGGDDARRNNDVNGAVDTTGFSVDNRGGVIMTEAGSSRGYVCRPRDPTWARLIFAERKR